MVEFEITPNRPDCLSVIGLAREAAVTFGKPLKLHTPEIRGCGGSIADLVDIEIEDPDLCPRYTARMLLFFRKKRGGFFPPRSAIPLSLKNCPGIRR